RDLGPPGLQVADPLLHGHPDRPGREVDDRRVPDLRSNGVLDREEILDLVRRYAIGRAGVDVDMDAPLIDDPPRLGRVFLRGVGNRRTLVAIGDRSGDGARDDGGVVDGHTGTTPWRFHGRSTR